MSLKYCKGLQGKVPSVLGFSFSTLFPLFTSFQPRSRPVTGIAIFRDVASTLSTRLPLKNVSLFSHSNHAVPHGRKTIQYFSANHTSCIFNKYFWISIDLKQTRFIILARNYLLEIHFFYSLENTLNSVFSNLWFEF